MTPVCDFAKIVPENTWESLTGDHAYYVCRANVTEEHGKFLATAVRCPNIQAQGDSRDEAIRNVTEAFRAAIESRHVAFRPIQEFSAMAVRAAVQTLVRVDANSAEGIEACLMSETFLSERDVEKLQELERTKEPAKRGRILPPRKR